MPAHAEERPLENLAFPISALWRRRGRRGLAFGLFCTVVRAFVLPRIDLVWTINDAGTALLRDSGLAQVEKTRLGFPERLFFAEPERREATRKRLLDVPVFAYFGQLSPENGVHLLLEALEGKQGQWTLLIDAFVTRLRTT